ncbi:hypothetical protein OVA11_18995 [Caulobacter sp. SL161]|uniref:hypothetical protein n=1 Tax=Caulobacter sp. SL161 TaxID=2995156 RepID=UPI002272A7B7|nr:hypothetical protein [Caulobacter sp. SL161]MCY1649065.1 hypothetical protein [Caulobacter sp. SL161]
MTTTPTQHANAIAAAIAAFHSGGSQSTLAGALATALAAYDDVGGLAGRIEALITENATILDSLELFTPKGAVDLVSNLPTGEELGAFYVVTSGEFAGHGYLLSAGGWEDLGLVRGASAYQVWRDQPGNASKTEAEYLTWLANAQVDAVTEAVQPLVDAAEAARDASVAAKDAALITAGEVAGDAAAAEAARAAAVTAQGGSQAARDASVAARDTAVIKAGEASDDAAAAEAARAAAVTAQGGSEAARDASVAAKDTAVIKAGEASDDAAAAEAARAAAVTAQGGSEAARDASVAAKDTAVIKAGEASDDAAAAEAARAAAVTAQGDSEAARDAAEAARVAAEAARDQAETIVGGDFIARPGGTTMAGKVLVAVAADGGTVEGRPIGAAAANEILDRQTGDARFQPLATSLTSLAALSSTSVTRLTSASSTSSTGFMVQISSTGLSARRTLTSADAGIAVTNGNGVSGNPTFTLGRATEAQGIAGTDNVLAMTALSTKAAITDAIGALNYTSSPIAASRLTGVIDTANLPAVVINDTFEVGSQAAMLALTAQRGDIAIRTDENKTYVLSTDSPATLADWKWMRTPTDVVLSVAGLTGVVTQSALKTALAMSLGDVAGLTAALAEKQASSTILTALAALTGGAAGQVIKKTAGGFEFGDGGGVGVEIGDTFFSQRSTMPAGIVPANGAKYLASAYPEAAGVFPKAMGTFPATSATAYANFDIGGVGQSQPGPFISEIDGELWLGNCVNKVFRSSNPPSTAWTAIDVDTTGTRYTSVVTKFAGLYVVGAGANIYTSPTGNSGSWTQRTNVSANIRGFASDGDILVAAGENGIWYSENAIAWTKATAPGSESFPTGVAYGNGRFVAMSSFGQVFYSDDGMTWTSNGLLSSFSATSNSQMTFAGGYFIIPSSGPDTRISADGQTWAAMNRTNYTSVSIYKIIEVEDYFFCIMQDGTNNIGWFEDIAAAHIALFNNPGMPGALRDIVKHPNGRIIAACYPSLNAYSHITWAPLVPAQFTVPSIPAQGTGTMSFKARPYTRIA